METFRKIEHTAEILKSWNEYNDKSKILETLNLAVEAIHEEDPNFQGIFIYWSFLRSHNFRDIDILPVLLTERPENSYSHWIKRIQGYFTKYFPDFSEPRAIPRAWLEGRTDYFYISNILHIWYDLVFLDKPRKIKETIIINLWITLDYFHEWKNIMVYLHEIAYSCLKDK